jgi:DNA recombination protein RmuC
MVEVLMIISILLLVGILILVFLTRSRGEEPCVLIPKLEVLGNGLERVERSLREELSKNREETAANDSRTRQEVGERLDGLGTSTQTRLAENAELLTTQLGSFSSHLNIMTQTNEEKLENMRAIVDLRLQHLQEDSGQRLDQIREETKKDSHAQREEIVTSLKTFNESLLNGLNDMTESQRTHAQSLSQSMENRFDALRNTIDGKLKQIQDDNTKKLEEMRATVDEKLQGTLEKRLGEAFKHVSERLEQVHQGLGEMQTLAVGVGDLKKALVNVKTRGGWAEVQLGALLEDLLAPTQYERNFRPKESSAANVEYAIKFPGHDGISGDAVWLPIDSKFPIEDYHRLADAQEKADLSAIDVATKALELRIKGCAKDISEKYLNPPRTTDFAIMFLPTEGLYAEVIRRTGLVETIRRDYNVIVAGPTTFGAFVNSLQMGFRTLAIQERSSEVWTLLGAVKTQFRKFGDVLDGVKKKLEQATISMDAAATRSRAIERKLRDVQELPTPDAELLLLGTDVEAEPENGSSAARVA